MDIPPIPPAEFEAYFGARIQRTMTLLGTSNAKRRRTVKILFYGQSITQGLQWERIVKTLKDRYPHADIVAENRAIGGFTAPALIRTCVHDLYPYYPDLVVFHVYHGALSGEWEQIIHNVRKYTTAEILVFTHQIAWVEEPEGMRKRRKSDDEDSDNIRYVAQKYDCELVEVRREWQQYLDANKLTPNQLMGDTVHSNVHPNAKGHTLLADLILRHFRFNPLFPCKWYDRVRTYQALRPLDEKADEIVFAGEPWRKVKLGAIGSSPKGTLKLTFEGNRVDVIALPAKNLGTARILIDGKPPSQFPELYAATRPSAAKGVWWPAIRRVSLGANAVPEKWTLRLTEVADDASSFSFDVAGSATGPDGSGASGRQFVSDSGRIRIDPADFTIRSAQSYRKNKHQVGFEVTWEVVPLLLDTWKPRPIANESLEDRCTLAQGLENGRHTLEIIPNGDGNVPIREIVVHRPPIR